MREAMKNWEGRVVEGEFVLQRYLGGSDHSSVFLTERKNEPRKAAIKLISANGINLDVQLLDWKEAARLSHPNVLRLFEMGTCTVEKRPYAYVVMEYADEDLSQLLPIRALSAAEARQMLPPVINAIEYLHKEGFIHCHINPANIMASGDQVKISGDGIVKADLKDRTCVPASYGPPEGRMSSAGEIWSLGITLVEVLTQQSPVGKTPGKDQPLLSSLPAPFSEITRECLQPDPSRRLSIEDLARRLNLTFKPAQSRDLNQRGFGKRGWLVAAVVFFVVMLALVAIFRRHTPKPQAASSFPVLEVRPQQPSTNAPSNLSAENPPSPAQTETASPPSNAAATHSPHILVEKVLPNVPRSARNTIHGTIRVTVRVTVNPSGRVSDAALVLPGSSKYFANLALEAARKWTFAPAQTDSGETPRTAVAQFEFRRSGTRASMMER
jgi:TonB family protein